MKTSRAADPPARQPVAESTSLPEGRREAISPWVQAIDGSPRVVAQRRQLEGLGLLKRPQAAHGGSRQSSVAGTGVFQRVPISGTNKDSEELSVDEIEHLVGQHLGTFTLAEIDALMDQIGVIESSGGSSRLYERTQVLWDQLKNRHRALDPPKRKFGEAEGYGSEEGSIALDKFEGNGSGNNNNNNTQTPTRDPNDNSGIGEPPERKRARMSPEKSSSENSDEVNFYSAIFKSWSSSISTPKSVWTSISTFMSTAMPSLLGGRGNVIAGDLVYVIEASSRSEIVIDHDFVPNLQQLQSGRIWLDSHEGTNRWLYYHDGPLIPIEEIPAAPLVTVSPTGHETLLSNDFTPDQEDLDSGRYWLDAQGEDGPRWLFYSQGPLVD